MQCRKIELYTRFETVPSPEQLTALREMVKKAAEHYPIAYLIGRKEFFSIEFEVTPAVLIPRPETETLVQKTIELCRNEPDSPKRILDLCTGSGCIAVAIAKYVPNAVLFASDVSPDALAVARRNAERAGLAERITWFEAAGLNLPAGSVEVNSFDILVSNPPYIAESEYEQLPRNVRDYEPRLALAAGMDGLDFYRRIANESARWLRDGGAVLVEIGANQSHEAIKLFESSGRFIHQGTFRDPTDPHDRVVYVRSRAG